MKRTTILAITVLLALSALSLDAAKSTDPNFITVTIMQQGRVTVLTVPVNKHPSKNGGLLMSKDGSAGSVITSSGPPPAQARNVAIKKPLVKSDN